MKEVEQLVYARMIADTGTGSLVALLGNSNRILHAFQSNTPPAPGLTYQVFNTIPGHLAGDFIRTLEVFVQFNIFSNSYPDIVFRLKRLFDGYRFDVPGNYTQLGAVSAVFDWEGSDGFDEQLQIQRKDCRFRFFVAPKAQSPI